MDATLLGSDRLKAKFGKLSEVARGKTLERALVAGALPVQNDAKRAAAYLTGNLRRSIHIGGHNELNPDAGTVLRTTGAGVPQPEIGTNNAAVYVGTDVIYAPVIEFGGSKRAPRPFMRPAFDNNRSAAMQEIAAALRELIRAAI